MSKLASKSAALKASQDSVCARVRRLQNATHMPGNHIPQDMAAGSSTCIGKALAEPLFDAFRKTWRYRNSRLSMDTGKGLPRSDQNS